MSKPPTIQVSNDGFHLIGYVFRCPDCDDLLEFEQSRITLNKETLDAQPNSGQFICYKCDEEGVAVDQNKMRFCQKSFLKAMDNLPVGMRPQLFITHWSEVNR